MEFRAYIGTDLARNLTELGVPSAFVERVITPQTIKYHFNLENLRHLPKVKKVAELLSAHLHEPIKVLSSKMADFCLEFVREQRDFPRFIAYHTNLVGKPTGEILFGIDDNGQPITRNIRQTKSILIASSSGGGKSVLLSNIICSLACYSKPSELSMTLIDLKRCEFSLFRNLGHLNHEVITDYTTALDTLKAIRGIIDSRYEKMEQLGIRQATTDQFPIMCIIIDEYAELASRGNKQELDSTVASISATGRACNVFLIIATQHAVGSIISNVIKSNMQTKIGLRTTNTAQSICAIGSRDCVDLLGYGDSFIHFDGTAQLKRVQVCNLTDADIYGMTCNLPPRTWNASNFNKTPPKTRKPTFVDKILALVGYKSNKGNFEPNNNDYNIEEQSFYETIDEE